MNTAEKWKKIQAQVAKLKELNARRAELMRELERSVIYYGALAVAGVEKEDVESVICGCNVSLTDNYKRTVKVKRCGIRWCSLQHKEFPFYTLSCPNCNEPLIEAERRILPAELRGRYARAVVGVRMNDGRVIWFDKPLPEA